MLKEELINYWIPVGLTCLVILLLLRPRIHLLYVNWSNKKGYSFYQFVAFLIIGVPFIMLQINIDCLGYGLVKVDNVNKIESLKGEKYFEIASYSAEPDHLFEYTDANYSGRHNSTLNFNYYGAIPFQTENALPKYWFCYSTSSSVSSSSTQRTKDNTYTSFVNDARNQIRKKSKDSVTYFERILYSNDQDGFLNALGDNVITKLGNSPVFLKPQTGAFAERKGSSLKPFVIALIAGHLIFFLMLFMPTLNNSAVARFKSAGGFSQNDISFFKEIRPRKGFFATHILFALNLIIFICMVLVGSDVINPGVKTLVQWGGVQKGLIESGEYYRLITANFIHSGLFHLITNMAGLVIVGIFLESDIKPLRTFLIYILTGIASAYSVVYMSGDAVSVGASGAIMGMFGCMFGLLAFKKSDPSNWLILIFIGLPTLLFGLLIPGINNAAHFTGFISGFLLSIPIQTSYRKGKNKYTGQTHSGY